MCIGYWGVERCDKYMLEGVFVVVGVFLWGGSSKVWGSDGDSVLNMLL